MNHRIRHHLETVTHLTWQITYLGALMANDIQALNDEIAKLGAAVADFETREASTVAALNQTITDLKAQIAAGTPVDTTAQIGALEAILATIPAAPPAP